MIKQIENTGRLIIIATKSIRSKYELSPQEQEAARKIANILKARDSERNEEVPIYTPIYVEAIGPYHYYNFHIVANHVILEAFKLAGLEEIRAIQIGVRGYTKGIEESIDEILKIQKILESAKIPARPKKIRRPKQHKALVNKDKYFQSEGQRVVYSLLELNGQARQKALGVTVKHYGDMAIAQEWRDNLAKIIDPNNCCDPDAVVAMTELDEMYSEMIGWEESP